MKSGVEGNGNDTNILTVFNLLEPRGFLIKIIPINMLYQNVTQRKTNYIEFHSENFKEDQLTLMEM